MYSILIQQKAPWSGDRYEGQFANDMFNGQGVYYFKSGGFYNGTWLNDERSGQGERLYSNGDKYSGEWKDDNLNGQGVYIFKSGGFQKKIYLRFVICLFFYLNILI